MVLLTIVYIRMKMGQGFGFQPKEKVKEGNNWRVWGKIGAD